MLGGGLRGPHHAALCRPVRRDQGHHPATQRSENTNCKTSDKTGWLSIGAGEGNRTLVCSLGSCRSAIELRPQSCRYSSASAAALHRSLFAVAAVTGMASRGKPPGGRAPPIAVLGTNGQAGGSGVSKYLAKETCGDDRVRCGALHRSNPADGTGRGSGNVP